MVHLLLQATSQPDIAVMHIWPLREIWDPFWALPEFSRQKLPTYMSVDSWSSEVASSSKENDQTGHRPLPLTWNNMPENAGVNI